MTTYGDKDLLIAMSVALLYIYEPNMLILTLCLFFLFRWGEGVGTVGPAVVVFVCFDSEYLFYWSVRFFGFLGHHLILSIFSVRRNDEFSLTTTEE